MERRQDFAMALSSVLLPLRVLTLVLISAPLNKFFKLEAQRESHEFFSGLVEVVMPQVPLAVSSAYRRMPSNLLNVLPPESPQPLAP
jgi:hypothetical protein